MKTNEELHTVPSSSIPCKALRRAHKNRASVISLERVSFGNPKEIHILFFTKFSLDRQTLVIIPNALVNSIKDLFEDKLNSGFKEVLIENSVKCCCFLDETFCIWIWFSFLFLFRSVEFGSLEMSERVMSHIVTYCQSFRVSGKTVSQDRHKLGVYLILMFLVVLWTLLDETVI